MDAPASRPVGSRRWGDGRYHSVILKLELLSQGLGISPAASEEIGKSLKVDHAVGAVGKHALDIILKPGKVYVGLPHGSTVNDHFEKDTPFLLDVDGEGQYFIAKKPARLLEDGRWACIDDNAPAERIMDCTLPSTPGYYEKSTSRGHSMQSIMPFAGDFGGATIFPHCVYFGHFVKEYEGTECRFCGIDQNLESGRDPYPKRVDDFLETMEEARKHPGFRHGPVFAGGTTSGPDRGAKVHAKFLKPIKEAFPDNWLRLTIAPPTEEKYVDMLFEAGVDMVGYNYEIYDPQLFAKLCWGKVKDIENGVPGHAQYDHMIRHIVRNYGMGHANANLLAGLEPAQRTVDGIEHLASIGVIPTIFVFVPLKGTALADQRPPSIREMIYIYASLKSITEEFGVDTYCAGCCRMLVNTKFYDGMQPTMPEVTEDDLRHVGLPPEDLYQAPPIPFQLNCAW